MKPDPSTCALRLIEFDGGKVSLGGTPIIQERTVQSVIIPEFSE
jgi:hypothetical protein